MIEWLSVRNIALIESLDLALGDGLNILSGETGAGKSIIIDSLNFVLGERADKSLIRYGADSASVEAAFCDYLTPQISAYMEEFGIEPEDTLVIRRKMSVDGKNECRINGRISTLSVLKGLTELLVDIHGQHEHQSLVKPSNHLGMLDALGGDGIAAARDAAAAAYAEYRALKEEFARFGDEDERARKLDILAFQIEELEKADLRQGEEDDLLEKRARIRNAEKIISALDTARGILEGRSGASIAGELKSAASALIPVSSYDERFSAVADRLDSAKTEIADIADTLSGLVDESDFDAGAAERVEERLERVRALKRKYGGSVEAAIDFLDKAREEKQTLENAAERVNELQGLIRKAGAVLSAAAEKLSSLRADCARKFERDITGELNDLGMGGTTFEVRIASDFAPDSVSENGGDSVEFLISPNIGEPLKPLAKIISGGEMSRFMLAMKNIVAAIDNIGTMVFDEIDTGISGRISAVVAEKMCNISMKRQVIAVTHMPALAAMADRHYLIEKGVEDGKTLTHITLLDDSLPEIARLIGGADYSSHALPHAAEMKKKADEYKENARKK